MKRVGWNQQPLRPDRAISDRPRARNTCRSSMICGGYVGVDVFFVISGFLIINQIKDALEAGRFSILSFYARRALRILPPFLLMLFAVVLVAPFIIPTPN